MAGAFDKEVSSCETLWAQAHTTYVANLQFAAEECSKVGRYLTSTLSFLHVFDLIEKCNCPY